MQKGAVEQSFEALTMLAMFGKGGFKLLKSDQETTDKQILFTLVDHNQLVVLNNAVVTLGKVLSDQRDTKPDATFCYHSMTLNTDNPKQFTCQVTHKVVFQTQDAAGDLSANNIGAKEALSTWNTDVLMVIWHVRWAQKGLMPVKPAVYLRAGVTLGAGKACTC